jgi:Flp pilus assembly protein TadG
VGSTVIRRILAIVWGDERGSALLEGTILTPVLFLMVFGVFEFSWYFYNQQVVEIGLRDAARYLARGPGGGVVNTSNPCSDATAVAYAQNLAANGKLSGGSPRINGWSAANVTITCPQVTNSGGIINPIYTVKAFTSFPDPSFGVFGLLGLSVPSITVSHTERAMGSG